MLPLVSAETVGPSLALDLEFRLRSLQARNLTPLGFDQPVKWGTHPACDTPGATPDWVRAAFQELTATAQ